MSSDDRCERCGGSMAEPEPSEFVAAHELKRYPPQLVLELIRTAKEWRDYHVPGLGWRVQTTALVDAVDALDGVS